jgi:hypothetical protein
LVPSAAVSHTSCKPASEEQGMLDLLHSTQRQTPAGHSACSLVSSAAVSHTSCKQVSGEHVIHLRLHTRSSKHLQGTVLVLSCTHCHRGCWCCCY